MRRRRYGWVGILGLIVIFIVFRSYGHASGKTIRERILDRRAEMRVGTISARGPASCASALNVGFRITTFSTGLRAAVWYPTTEAEAPFLYADRLAASVAHDAPVAECSQFPLVVFSHGFGGCGTQSVFFTEALARSGYIVVAPDHKDAICKVDQPRTMGGLIERADEPFRSPENWNDTTYKNRRNDIEVVLNEIVLDPVLGPRINQNQIGAAGHSLGGYTVAGMAGAWPSWKDGRIKAALLMSPYIKPFLVKNTFSSMNVPVMYQGGTRDRSITPGLENAGGAYDLSNGPKFFMKFTDAGHFGWTILTCRSEGTTEGCDQKSPLARQIDSYGIAFFDRYLKGMPEEILDKPNAQLADMRHTD